MVQIAVQIAAHPAHGFNVKHGIANLGDGNCAPEAANDNNNHREELAKFHNKIFETPQELREAVVENIIKNEKAIAFTGYDDNATLVEDLKKLKQSGEWGCTVADLMMPGIAFTLEKNILVVNTKPNQSSQEPITLIRPETFGGHSNTDIPLILAYNGSHYEGLIPEVNEDIDRSAELVRKIKNNAYAVKVSDIPCLLSQLSLLPGQEGKEMYSVYEKQVNDIENDTDVCSNVLLNSHVDVKKVEELENKDTGNLYSEKPLDKSGFLSFLKEKDFDKHDDIVMEERELGNENDEDPYFDENDDHDFTLKRLSNMNKRYEERNLDLRIINNCDLPGNREIMEDFTKYLEDRSAATFATGEKTSTVRKYAGHIFHYHDSFLSHQMAKNKSFRAADNFCFGKPEHKLLSDPLEWIGSGERGKAAAGRKRERMKAFAAYREYMRNCLGRDKDKFGTNVYGLMMLTAIYQDLDRMERKIKDSSLWDTYGKMETQQRVAKESAVKTINPMEEANLSNAIAVWNDSELRKLKLEETKQTYEKAIKGIRPTEVEFNALVQMTKFECHNLNRDRHSAYKFTNGDYISKRAQYVPKSVDTQDEGKIYTQMPVGWNSNAPPKDSPDMPPSGWVLEVLGDVAGMKTQSATAVSFTPRVKELCERYRTVRDIFFKVWLT